MNTYKIQMRIDGSESDTAYVRAESMDSAMKKYKGTFTFRVAPVGCLVEVSALDGREDRRNYRSMNGRWYRVKA